MTTDPTEAALNKIHASFDRFQEAHWWIHAMELHYHEADLFRWHLSAFLKAIKESPLLLRQELQNHPGFPTWFRAQKKKLQADPLLRFLSEQRDYVVHRGMLKPGSRGTIGITEGRGIKLGISMPINPLEDSELAMTRYLYAAADPKGRDFLGILVPDDDSLPCVQREWRLAPFQDEVVDLVAKAWITVGETVTTTVRWLGAEVPDLSLTCRHSSQRVQFKLFDRKKLKKQLREIRKSGRVTRTGTKRLTNKVRSCERSEAAI
jgi:hypothetical protein